MPQLRYHSFDSLRAVMMLMGIWMHGVQCYTRLDVYMWPFKDAARSAFFDFTVNWVHVFRMPVFFAMAGFFFALLTARRGTSKALGNRTQRILLPFLLGWAVLAPIIIVSVGYMRTWKWAAALASATQPAVYWKAGPLHLWFLEYLLLLYPLTLASDWLLRRLLGARGLYTASSLFRWILESRGRAVWMAAPTVGPMMRMGGWFATPNGFTPNLRILFLYLLFFGFGWALYFERDLLDRIQHFGWVEFLAGCALTGVGHAVLTGALPQRVWQFAGPFATWLFLFGFMSLFMRYLDRPVGWVRYLSDASYWMYLLHVPLLIWVQVLIAPLPLPALLKGLLAIGISMPLLVVSYHFAVRPTWVGLLLNGRRYPLRSAAATAATEVALERTAV